jgi:hypothetical protein
VGIVRVSPWNILDGSSLLHSSREAGPFSSPDFGFPLRVPSNVKCNLIAT